MLPLNKRKTTLFALAKESGVRVLPYSAESGEGRDGLWRALCELCGIAAPAAAKSQA
jgi:hypothetical protein